MELEEAKKLVKRSNVVPVRIVVRKNKQIHRAGRCGHFSRGNLVGIRGNKLLVKPHAHGGKVERMNPDQVHLWYSRAVDNGLIGEDEMKTNGRLTVDEQSTEKDNLFKEIEEHSPSETYVIADLDPKSNRVLFFLNSYKGFQENFSEVHIYQGKGSFSNAKRALSKLKISKKWSKIISHPDNLLILPIEEADRIWKQQSNSVSPQESIETPLDDTEPSNGEHKEARVKANEKDSEPFSEPSEPQSEPQFDQTGNEEGLNSIIYEVQKAYSSTQDAIDLLKSEYERLEQAKQRLVSTVLSRQSEINSMIENYEKMLK